MTYNLGLVKEVLCDDLEAAQTKAGAESANTSGHSVPVVVFSQGNRINMAGAVSFAFVRSRLESKSSKPKASISDVNANLNRPEVPEHSDSIARYLVENVGGRYILPPLTLNVQQTIRLYVVNYPGAQVRPGYLVIPATAKLAITDGQHRRSGIIKAIDRLDPERQEQLLQDGLAVMITCEKDVDQIHQDFADCSKTKSLSPSQVAVYDRRNPANRLVVDAERLCPLLSGKVDATSQKLGIKSTSIFTANQIRQFVKCMMVGSWGMADQEFEKRARERCKTEENYVEWRDRIVEYFNLVVQSCPVMKELSEVQGAVGASRVPARRQEGWICLTASGLVVIGLIGNHLLSNTSGDQWREYAERLGKLDWGRGAEHWQGVLVQSGKINTNQSAVRAALIKVSEMIGLSDKPIAVQAA